MGLCVHFDDQLRGNFLLNFSGNKKLRATVSTKVGTYAYTHF